MNSRRDATNEIDEKATNWVIALDKGALTPSMQAELNDWLLQDARHRGAFLRAQAVWKGLDRLGILPSDELDPPTARFAMSRRNLLVAGGAVAAAAVFAVKGVSLWSGRGEILTSLGEIYRVPLDDGSLVAVNTDSALNVAFKQDLREIRLERGEAWFDVAKDSDRPFVVTVGEVRVRAVGTAFSVRKQEDGVDVLVTEGVVETWAVGAEHTKKLVSAGSKALVSNATGPSIVAVTPGQLGRTLAWRDGEIALDGETLADAAMEFNRYNSRKLFIDPAFSEQRLVGWFHTNEPETFANAAATTVGAKVIVSGDEIRLVPMPNL